MITFVAIITALLTDGSLAYKPNAAESLSYKDSPLILEN
jgi:hypothetical protein